eukprot:544519_1
MYHTHIFTFHYICLLFSLIPSVYSTNTTTVPILTTEYPVSSLFHTTGMSFFIEFNVLIVYECDVVELNACPDLSTIGDTFDDILYNAQEIFSLNEMIRHDTTQITHNENNATLRIHSVIRTNDINDFKALQTHLNSGEFDTLLTDDLSRMDDRMQVSHITVTITHTEGDENEDDETQTKWYESWLDPMDYKVYQYATVGAILLFLLIGIIALCCCIHKKKGDEEEHRGIAFMKNPQRYDSEFPGHEMQPINTNTGMRGVRSSSPMYWE